MEKKKKKKSRTWFQTVVWCCIDQETKKKKKCKRIKIKPDPNESRLSDRSFLLACMLVCFCALKSSRFTGFLHNFFRDTAINVQLSIFIGDWQLLSNYSLTNHKALGRLVKLGVSPHTKAVCVSRQTHRLLCIFTTFRLVSLHLTFLPNPKPRKTRPTLSMH